MATCFDQWAKDPFFPAAEEVQESADRMESVYRTWIHEMRDASSSNSTGNGGEFSGELLRELRTALGTAKWQLETLEKAVRSNDDACSVGNDTRIRHKQFVEAIENQISKVENAILRLNQDENQQSKLMWVQLDDGEQDELARFLSLPPLPKREKAITTAILEQKVGKNQSKTNKESEFWMQGCNSNQNNGMGFKEVQEEKKEGHRRTASASADIGSWKITLSAEDVPHRSFQEQAVMPPKIPSLSCLAKALESTSKTNYSNNGCKKWKVGDQYHAEEMLPLRNNKYSRETKSCEKGMSCNNCCGDDHYDKQFHNWLGTLYRQLQRSQYHIQYGRPVQTVLWTIFVILLLVVVALQTI